MAVTCSNITHGKTTAASSATTASVTLTANRLYLLTVTSRNATVDPNQPTVTNFTQVNTDNYDNAGSQKRITVLRILPAATTTGTLSIGFAAQTQTDIIWILDEFTGMDTSGVNGAGAIVQSVVNQDRTGSGTTLTATLAAFASTANATYGSCGIGNEPITFTPGSGFTTIAQDGSTGNLTGVTEFKNSNDTTVDFTSSVAGELGIIAMEIRAEIIMFTG